MIYKLSKHDIEILKKISASPGRSNRVTEIRAGIRYNIEDDTKPQSVNIMVVSDTGDWDETDLFDTIDIKDLARYGFELDKDGYAELDFYVYSNDGLMYNMSANFDQHGIISANRGSSEWERPLSDG
jgi:hypothetical protein